MGKDVIVACDFASAEATFEFLDKFVENGLIAKLQGFVDSKAGKTSFEGNYCRRRK